MPNNALLYRPAPKCGVAIAFAVAAALHLSAVALASLHHQPPMLPSSGFTEVDVEPSSPEPAPETREIQQQPPQPGPEPSPEFVDIQTQPRPLSKRTFGPIRSPAPQSPHLGSGKPVALKAPRPEYPYEARSRHITGSGIVTLAVDPLTGQVGSATLTQSTGNSILDHSALSAFQRWQFPPGTPSMVRIPFTFTLTGVTL